MKAGRLQRRDLASPAPRSTTQFLAEIIRLVVMIYVRFPLNLRNVEDLLAERGIDIKTVRH